MGKVLIQRAFGAVCVLLCLLSLPANTDSAVAKARNRQMPPLDQQAANRQPAGWNTVVVLKRPLPLRAVAESLPPDLPVISMNHVSSHKSGGFYANGMSSREAASIYGDLYASSHNGSEPRVITVRLEGKHAFERVKGFFPSLARRFVLPKKATMDLSHVGAVRRWGPRSKRDQVTVGSPTSRSQSTDKKYSWMPDRGTLMAQNLAGDNRAIVQTMEWESQTDIDAFPQDPPVNPLDPGEDWAYEHDFKLFLDESLGCDYETGWADRPGLVWETNFPSDVGHYYDTAGFFGEPCETDLTIGMFHPRRLEPGVLYTTSITATGLDNVVDSRFHLRPEALPIDCQFGVEEPWCVDLSQNGDRERVIEDSSLCRVPGFYRWTSSQTDVNYNRCYADRISQAEPLAYWRLDESSGSSANDAMSNNLDGTYYGSPSKGYPGATHNDDHTAVRFDGVDDSVQVPYNSAFSSAALTLEAWMRSTGRSGNLQLLMSRDGTSGHGIYVYNNQLKGRLKVGGSLVTLLGPNDVMDGRWHHVALTFDGTTARLYFDGDQQSSATPTGSLAALTSTALRFGDSPVGDRFVGDLDEVAIYDHALSSQEVKSHFDAAQGAGLQCAGGSDYSDLICESQPLGYWRLDETLGIAHDQVTPPNAATAYGSPVSHLGAVVDESDSSTGFDGTNDEIAVPYDPYGRYATNQGSFEGWFRTTRRDVSQGQVIFNRSEYGLSGQTLYVSPTNVTKGRLYIGGTQYDLTGVKDVADGRWHHATVTFDGSTAKLWVDGVLERSVSVSGKLDWFVNSGIKIGRTAGTSPAWFGGDIDEVAVYDRALTQTEVEARVAAAGSWSITCSQGLIPYRGTICSSNPVGYWAFDESSGTAADDVTSANNDGSYVNGPTLGQSGVSGSRLTVDGSNDEVLIPYETYGRYASDKGSMEAWIRTTTRNLTQVVVNRSTGSLDGHLLYVTSSNTAKGRFNIGGSTYSVTGTSDVANGAWHHIAATYDGTTVKLYVDGSMQASTSVTGKLNWLVNSGVIVGRTVGTSSSTWNRFTGDVDEVAIYDRALTLSEVQARVGYAP